MRLLRIAVTSTRAASALALATLAVCLVAFTPSASASIAPTLTLDQSGGTQAGATQALGLDMAFAPSSGDSPKTLTITLPRGLLASASADNGACLQWTGSGDDTPPAACEVGSGTADATASILGLPVGAEVDLTFYLVAPPKAGDLAGLYVTGTGTGIPAALLGNLGQIGSTGDISVGQNVSSLSIALSLPETVDGLSTSIDSIDSTFSAIRYPTTCPSTPEQVSIAATSYSDSTVKSATAPLTVTGCSSLPFAPKYSAIITKDANDNEVTLQSDITEASNEAPSSSIALHFPLQTLLVNLEAAHQLCANVASGTCTAVGSATASSPLYPTPLTGKAYLTGTVTKLQLTLVFPSPFPITLTGSVNLGERSTTFTGLPDIPLTDLAVVLNGGVYAPFLVQCSHPTGVTSASFVSQSGATASASDTVTVSGCKSTTPPKNKEGKPTVTGGRFSGLKTGKVSSSFTVKAGSKAPAIRRFSVQLTAGLTFHRHGNTVKGVTLSGGKAKSLSVSGGQLVIVLASTSRSVGVKLAPTAITESRQLIWKATHNNVSPPRIKSLRLYVTVTDASGKTTDVRQQVKNLGL